ncbi:MAG: hypothetical protein BHV81_02010 [Butyricimonas synergistica]|nr:MAG: hypothetical protein BHV81_02010 [Butyricimonas synergistica]
MEIIEIASKVWYKLYVILFCCILNAGVLNASGRSDGNTTVYAVAEPYSYDEFIAMLDREGKVPLENIQEETDPAIIQMYVAQKQQFLRGGGRALKLALDRMSPSYNVRASAGFVREYKLNKGQQKKLEAVYKWKSLEQDKLIKRMGKKDLMKRYAELSPLFAHLNILEEAKIRECMNPEQHALYFRDLMEEMRISHQPDNNEPCSCKCFYHLNVSLLGIGGIQNWIVREVKYPIMAQERNIQGKVVVGFLINTDGSISDVHVVRSVDPSLDAESVRVMRRLPSFAPVICPIHKRKVAVYYTAPINFQLQ